MTKNSASVLLKVKKTGRKEGGGTGKYEVFEGYAGPWELVLNYNHFSFSFSV
jgi:hypothetical protein